MSIMPRTRAPYPPEFRAEAVRLVREGGRKQIDVARELGMSVESLRQWIHQAEIEEGKREGLTLAEKERLRQLERENRILREEREILKKAAAFFAKETSRTS
jgi:transposase